MAMAMSFPLFILILFFLPLYSLPDPISNEFLYPNSTFTYLQFIDNNGEFLSSSNSTFVVAFYDPSGQDLHNYLAILHSSSNSLVWSANPNSPLPSASTLSLSNTALSLLYPNGSVAWSTPPLASNIDSLTLLESGNLALLDANNSTLWQSFDHPTNTLLPGQRLIAGSFLSSAVSDSDLSDSGYRLLVTSDDAFLNWKGLERYWSLSADVETVKDYKADIAYMALNVTGLFLFDAYDRVLYTVVLPLTEAFRMGKLNSAGRFSIGNDFVAPAADCDLPFACGSLGLCAAGSNGTSCSCPPLFGAAASGGCSPADGSVLPSSTSCGAAFSYLSLGSRIAYSANKFTSADTSSADFSSCQSLCSGNCSCTGFFYSNSSQSCYLLKYQLGSVVQAASNSDTIGYIKTLPSPSPAAQSHSSSRNIIPILLPSIATILLLIVFSSVGFKWWRKRSEKTKWPANEVWHNSRLEDDEFSDSDEILIPGLPTRFTYTELALATNNFSTLVGRGGFGSVYKGELPDHTLIAVKKITNMGVQGKREFCTEIAVIGKIRHIYLLKLRGYCAQGTDRMLVYDYMNRGSLDRSLFGPGPALEWQDRLEIAIGTAKGLAYLHSGCDRKIIHCDIKPENILLADGGLVKVADFGMAKLMSPEQSGLFTAMRGTRGYIAPEWLTNTAITDKTDVYSFGMVLLEMLRGRKNRSSRIGSSSGEYFPMVAVEKHVGRRWLELLDPRMEGRVAEAEVERVVKVALCCLHEEPALRPSMMTVAGMLDGTLAVWEPRTNSLRFLRRYTRGYRTTSTVSDSGTNATTALLTCMSSQEVSGPR